MTDLGLTNFTHSISCKEICVLEFCILTLFKRTKISDLKNFLRSFRPRAFSLLEVSAVIVIIGILVAGVMSASSMLSKFRISSAKALTVSSPIHGIADSAFWLESATEESFPTSETNDGTQLTNWLDARKSATTKVTVSLVGNGGAVYSNTINYVHAVRFSGSSTNYLQIADASFLNSTDYTIFVLEKRTSSTANNYFLGSTSDGLALGYSADSSVIHTQGASSYNSLASSYSNSKDKARLFTFVQDSSIGKRTYINGILAGENTTDKTQATGITSLSIGKGYSGEIGEIAIFTRALRSEERKSVEDYLAKKWSRTIDRSNPSCIGYTITESGCDMTSAPCTNVVVAGVSSPISAASGASGTTTCNAAHYSGATISYSCSSGSLTSGTCACDSSHQGTNCADCNSGAGYALDGSGNCTIAAPANSVAPAIAATAKVGEAITTSNGTWSGSPTSYSYQWYWADTAAAISGATAISYTPIINDIGHTLLCKVVATGIGGPSSPASSNTTSAVASVTILDQLTDSPIVAYSVRKLKAAYSGSAMRVRRSSDNAEQDIGFTNIGNLDETSLLAFVGSGNGYVTTWYDQSGNNRHLTQSAASPQPTIVSGGAVYKKSGLPTLYHDATDDAMSYSGSNYISTTPLTLNLVAGSNSNAVMFRRAVQGSSNWLVGPYSNQHAWYAGGWNHQISSPWSTGGFEVITVIEPSGSTANTSWRNGSAVTTSNNKGVPGKFNTGTVGAANNEPLNGYISEVIGFATALSTTDRQKLEADQMTYY